ncbi:cobalamin B12-binding domain-containing protein [Candidatus Pacearchaeota archaeon]|nr:cobalamin B12-binding domain-containing protein [Candidatus Pacearchaeota archaeon]
MVKLLLIQPNYRNIYSYAGSKTATPIYPPLGLAYIAAVVREKGYEVKILEANAFDLNHEQIKEAIIKYNPDFVAMTGTSSMMDEITKLCAFLPENVKVIFGGIHASSMPDEVLRDYQRIDVLVRGEGEEAIIRIILGKPLKDILGVSYRDKKGKIIHNKDAPFIEDLDSLPFPARDLLPMHKYFSFEARRYPIDYIVSGRGCPYRCIFCADFITSGRKMRARSAENIIAEIKHLVDTYGTQEIDFQDDNFTLYPERVRKFCDLMIKTGLNKKIIWKVANGVRCDKLSLPMLKHMKKAGCYMLSLGIESGNQEILNKMRKAEKLEDIQNAAKWCREAGIESRGLFIFGLLGENRKTMLDTIRFAKSLPLDTATFHVCIPMPKTEYWNIIKREGQLLDVSWDKYTAYSEGAFKHGSVTPELMSEMQKRAYKEFYLRPEFIFRRFLRIRTAKDVKLTLKGGLEVLKFAGN